MKRRAADCEEVTIASVWPEDQSRMWWTAASSDSTTAAAMSYERYSVSQSSNDASTTVAGDPSASSSTRSSPCTVTPASASAASARGRNAAAMSWCTSSVSAALQTLGRCALELTRMSTAMSRSASASTYTWQLPVPVSITGTVDSSTTVRISDAPPRGISTSTMPRARISSRTDSRLSPGTSCTASAGSPEPPTASRRTFTRAALEADAEDEPRSSTALPDLRQRAAASTVTFGRAS